MASTGGEDMHGECGSLEAEFEKVLQEGRENQRPPSAGGSGEVSTGSWPLEEQHGGDPEERCP